MSIAITTVLPVPVAILRPTRGRPSLWSVVLRLEPARGSRRCRAGRRPRRGRSRSRRPRAGRRTPGRRARAAWRPSAARSLRVIGRDAVPVARPPELDLAADVVDERVLLAPLAGGVEVERLLLAPCPSCDGGTGMNDSLGRRPSRISPVGPSGPSSKWRSGGSYGELRIGLLKDRRR